MPAILKITNGNILGSTPSARLNKRHIWIRDSQLADETQWRPIAQFIADPRVDWGFIGMRRGGAVANAVSVPGTLNDGYGVFGAQETGLVRTMVDPGFAFPSPHAAHTQDLPGGVAHDLYTGEPGNFRLLEDQQRLFPPLFGCGDWFLNQGIRFGSIGTALPNGYNMTSSGMSMWTATAALGSPLEQTPAFPVNYQSNGTTVPHNSTVIQERPTTLTPTFSGGTFGMAYFGLWSVFGTELNTTVQDWMRFIRRCDASGNWIPGKFGWMGWGAGGERIDHDLVAGYTPGGGDTTARRWVNSKVQPIVNWYQPEQWNVLKGQNGYIAGDKAAHKAKVFELCQRLYALRPVPVVLWSTWVAAGVLATFDYATERQRYEELWAINEELARENPTWIAHAPLGEEVIRQLGTPAATGSWLSTHLDAVGDAPAAIHTSQTGAKGQTSIGMMMIDLLWKGGGTTAIKFSKRARFKRMQNRGRNVRRMAA